MLTLDGRRRQIWTTADTVDGALRQLGVRAEGALMSVSRSSAIPRSGLALDVLTERTVTFMADGREHTLRTNAATVYEALAHAGLTLRGEDTTSVRPDSFPRDGQTITVMRITRDEIVRDEAVPYDTERTPDPTLFTGTEVVTRQGEPGTRRLTYAVRAVNGVKEKPREIADRIVRAPVTQRVRVGTKRRPASVAGADGLNWSALAACESGGRPDAVDPSGTYGGLYQFDTGTWQSLGGSGRPQDASAGEQTMRAKKLYVQRGRVRGRTAAVGCTGEHHRAPDPDAFSALLGPADIRELAAALGVRPTKQRGQNFVIDANTVRRIVRTAGVRPDDVVVEVGPGLGSLTLALLEAAEHVTAVEIDDILAAALPRTVEARMPARADHFSLVHADAMQVRELPGPTPTALVANLPYNVAVPVLLHMLEHFPTIERTLIMVQAEVADRLAAAPGNKVYGVPSVKANWYAEVKRAGAIGRNVFWPAPNVDSGLVSLVRRPEPLTTTASRTEVFAVVDAAFAQRRKTLRAALAGWAGSAPAAETALVAAGISPQARGESLTVEEFARIAESKGERA